MNLNSKANGRRRKEGVPPAPSQFQVFIFFPGPSADVSVVLCSWDSAGGQAPGQPPPSGGPQGMLGEFHLAVGFTDRPQSMLGVLLVSWVQPPTVTDAVFRLSSFSRCDWVASLLAAWSSDFKPQGGRVSKRTQEIRRLDSRGEWTDALSSLDSR